MVNETLPDNTAAEPILHTPSGSYNGALAWQWPRAIAALSSAPVGGGFQTAEWLLNIGVPLDYSRIDLEEHATEIATELRLSGDGIALFTAANVSDWQRRSIDGVTVDATVGISKPTWAADPGGGWTPWEAGTINLVIHMPQALDRAAAVNAVMTATEAKTQALIEAGVPGTGTASDAVVIVWPTHSSEPTEQFAGPRSEVGSRIAQAVHATVASGVDTWHQRAGTK